MSWQKYFDIMENGDKIEVHVKSHNALPELRRLGYHVDLVGGNYLVKGDVKMKDLRAISNYLSSERPGHVPDITAAFFLKMKQEALGENGEEIADALKEYEHSLEGNDPVVTKKAVERAMRLTGRSKITVGE